MAHAPPVPSPRRPSGRLESLDGLRAVAALAVVASHFFVRWAEPYHEPTLYPHGNWIPWLQFLEYAGNYGVLLFFLISGFVIMMTLERSSGILDFIGRRAARLWPAMIVCATLSTLLINLSGSAFYYEGVERWYVTPVEYFSSIIFVPPDLTADLLGIQETLTPRWVEGVYWTLWAEVRFYALVSVVFLISRGKAFLWAWAGVQAVSLAIDAATVFVHHEINGLWSASLVFQPRMLAWFTLGLVAWKWRAGERSLPLLLCFVFAATSLLAGDIVDLQGFMPVWADNAPQSALLFAAIMAPLAVFLVAPSLLRPLAWKPLVTVGLASYPLYLFHERPGMVFLMWFEQAGIHPLAGLFASIAGLILFAVFLHRAVENPAKDIIVARWRPWAKSVETRYAGLRFGQARPQPAE